jgi:hypothetical protein
LEGNEGRKRRKEGKEGKETNDGRGKQREGLTEEGRMHPMVI